MALIHPLTALVSVALLACSSTSRVGDGSGGSAGSTTVEAGAANAGGGEAMGAAVGTFTFALNAAVASRPAYTSLLGRVYGSAVPSALEWKETARAGECALLEPRFPFCSPGCTGGDVCVSDDECVAYPRLLDAGTLSIVGLGSSFEVKPIAGSYQLAGGKTLPAPPCDEGAPFTIESSGAEVPAFELSGRGIAPLLLDAVDLLPFGGGQPLRLKWEPPKTGGSRITIRVDVSHHGGTKGIIECDAEDDGSAEISPELADGLVGLGTAGFPSLRIQRTARVSKLLPAGLLTVEMVSATERGLEIAGVTSCSSNQDCPSGTTCQSDRACH